MNRRSFLRGSAGAIVALPFLPSLARGQTPPKRFITFYHPNGVYELKEEHGQPSYWHARGSETSYVLGTSNSVLESLRPHLLWMNGIDLSVAVTGFGEQHQRGLGALLTGASLLDGVFVGNDNTKAGYPNGPSIDQELIGLLGAGSKAASVQLGVHAAERDVSGVLSYRFSGGPLPQVPQNDPLVVFRSLFSDIATPPGTLEMIRRRRASVLDQVLGQLQSVQSKLSASERSQLDTHLAMVRELEQRVTNTTIPTQVMSTCTQASEPPSMAPMNEEVMGQIAKLQMDLLVLALTCDITRIATVAFSDAKNHLHLPFLGLDKDIHNISHGSELSADRALLIKRDKWQAEQFGYFVQRLLDQNLLNDSLVFWGSELADGYTHSHVNMPFVFAGHAAGWTMGRNLTYASASHNDLLLSILQSFGGQHTTFGNPDYCTGPLSNLF